MLRSSFQLSKVAHLGLRNYTNQFRNRLNGSFSNEIVWKRRFEVLNSKRWYSNKDVGVDVEVDSLSSHKKNSSNDIKENDHKLKSKKMELHPLIELFKACTEKNSMDPILSYCCQDTDPKIIISKLYNLSYLSLYYLKPTSSINFMKTLSQLIIEKHPDVLKFNSNLINDSTNIIYLSLLSSGNYNQINIVLNTLSSTLSSAIITNNKEQPINLLNEINNAGAALLSNVNSFKLESSIPNNVHNITTILNSKIDNTPSLLLDLYLYFLGKSLLFNLDPTNKNTYFWACNSNYSNVNESELKEYINSIIYLSYYYSRMENEVLKDYISVYNLYLNQQINNHNNQLLNKFYPSSDNELINLIKPKLKSMNNLPFELLDINSSIYKNVVDNSNILKMDLIRRLLSDWNDTFINNMNKNEEGSNNGFNISLIEDYSSNLVNFISLLKNQKFNNNDINNVTSLSSILSYNLLELIQLLLEGKNNNCILPTISLEDKQTLIEIMKNIIIKSLNNIIQSNEKTTLYNDFIVTMIDISLNEQIYTIVDLWYWLNSMNCKNILLTTPIFISLIKGSNIKNRDHTLELMTLYSEMKSRNIKINIDVYIALFESIKGSSNKRRNQQAFEVLDSFEVDMLADGIEHNENSIKSIIISLFSCDRVSNAALKLEDMKIQNIKRGKEFYNEIFKACTISYSSSAWAIGEYEFLWKIMNEIEPNLEDIKNIIKCCVNIKDASSAIKFLNLAESLFETKPIILHGGQKSVVILDLELYDSVINALKTRDPLTMLEIENIREKKTLLLKYL